MQLSNNERIKQKLAYSQIKRYADQLEGVSGVVIMDRQSVDTVWHEQILRSVQSYNRRLAPTAVLPYPADTDFAHIWVKSQLQEAGIQKVIQAVDPAFWLSMTIIDKDLFLKSLWEYQGNRDLTLILFRPDRLIVFSDNEYELEYYHITADQLFTDAERKETDSSSISE
ncbi:hypothetical protein AR543_12410 [Paenibacillus bovis]|uniref:Uncharacterized protein n=2 Tax=Paenibacillus bovis TaxID=1616788 RepID=A0A172ZGF9_9BACL|nr:hypothetical protein AR543_12410 [Paenibacillus bovis]